MKFELRHVPNSAIYSYRICLRIFLFCLGHRLIICSGEKNGFVENLQIYGRYICCYGIYMFKYNIFIIPPFAIWKLFPSVEVWMNVLFIHQVKFDSCKSFFLEIKTILLKVTSFTDTKNLLLRQYLRGSPLEFLNSCRPSTCCTM